MFQVLDFAFLVQRYLCAQALFVLAFAFQFEVQVMVFKALVCFVLVNRGGQVDVVDHQIQVTVVVQIGVGCPVAVGGLGDAPGLTDILEAQVAVVFEEVVAKVGGGDLLHQFQHVLALDAALVVLDEIPHVF